MALRSSSLYSGGGQSSSEAIFYVKIRPEIVGEVGKVGKVRNPGNLRNIGKVRKVGK